MKVECAQRGLPIHVSELMSASYVRVSTTNPRFFRATEVEIHHNKRSNCTEQSYRLCSWRGSSQPHLRPVESKYLPSDLLPWS
jgi:hypothetical protein